MDGADEDKPRLTKQESEDFDRLIKEAKEAKAKADKEKKDKKKDDAKKSFSQTRIHHRHRDRDDYI